MKDEIDRLTAMLNAKSKESRLQALQELSYEISKGTMPKVRRLNECNNHVHSQYSFSPYSPSMIAWKAYQSGLSTCGIVDHESVSGCVEFREACQMLGIVPTIGFEIRLNFDHTPLKGKKFNNPDQRSIGYFPVHGVPINVLPKIETFLKPIRTARESRNKEMVKKINHILNHYDMELDFQRHVIPISKWKEGGSITERHLLFAAGQRMTEKFGKGEGLCFFLEKELRINLSPKAREYLSNCQNPCYEFDLTNLLKGFFSEKIYLPAAAEETPNVETIIPMLNAWGCIPTYTYLGDVKRDAVTGDKKPQKFEDEILNELFAFFESIGMQGFSYAPSRNSRNQLKQVKQLCECYNMLEVCGEDINQPRQPFLNQTLSKEEKIHFDNATWAIIGNERVAERNVEDGIFSAETKKKYPSIKDRIAVFRNIGMKETDKLP